MLDERVACQGHTIDFTTLTRRSDPAKVAAARATCATCPALMACLEYLETTETEGMAGGMLKPQRERWRARDGYEPQVATIVDVSEAAELVGAIVDDLPIRQGHNKGLSLELIEVIRRMTDAGFSAQEIVDRIDDDTVSVRTINYVRRTYFDSGLTAQRKRVLRRDMLGYVDRDTILQWAQERGLRIQETRGVALPSNLVAAYHRAHQEGADGAVDVAVLPVTARARIWARENGIAVASSGRVSDDILRDYAAATEESRESAPPSHHAANALAS